jgi:hypothetical protein
MENDNIHNNIFHNEYNDIVVSEIHNNIVKFCENYKKNINSIICSKSKVYLNECCSICMDKINYANYTITRCGHNFHSSCIFKMIKSNNNNCPICRTVLLD